MGVFKMTERPIRTKPTRGQSEVYERKKKTRRPVKQVNGVISILQRKQRERERER